MTETKTKPKKTVTWVEEPEMGFWESTFVPAIMKGLKTTLKHVTDRKTVTQQYPEVKPDLPLHYRGVHRLNRDEKDRVKCVACMMCATACPANCISIEAQAAPPEWPDRDKFPKSFVLDELRCIYCGMCEEACPTNAIQLIPDFEQSEYARRNLVYEKEDLLISGTGKYHDYNFYRVAGVRTCDKDKGQGANELPPVDVKSLMP